MGFSDFIDNAKCALGGRCKADDYVAQQVASVLSNVSTRIQDSCKATQTSQQTITCPLISSNCRNVTYVCGAAARQTFDCTRSNTIDLYQTAAQTIVDAVQDDRRVLQSVGAQIKSASENNADLNLQTVSAVATYLQNTCSSSQAAKQISVDSLLCDTSSNVTANFLSNVDQSTACVLVTANQITRAATAPVNRTKLALALFGGGVVVLLLLALGVFFAARGRAR